MDEFLSRKNIYGVAFLMVTALIIISAVEVEWRDNIYILLFNPIWPIVLFLMDVYLQHRDEKIIHDFDRKIGAVGSAVSTAKAMGDGENMPIVSILNATSGEDLLQKERDLQKERELDQKTIEAGKIDKGGEVNIDDI